MAAKLDTLEELLAVERIKELPSKYCWYVARREFEGILGLYLPDGLFEVTMDSKTYAYRGREALLGVLTGSAPTFPASENHVVVLTSPDDAYGTCTMKARAPTAPVPEFTGYYHDKYKRVEGKWYFAERRWFRTWPAPFERSGLDMDGKPETGLSADHTRGQKK